MRGRDRDAKKLKKLLLSATIAEKDRDGVRVKSGEQGME